MGECPYLIFIQTERKNSSFINLNKNDLIKYKKCFNVFMKSKDCYMKKVTIRSLILLLIFSCKPKEVLDVYDLEKQDFKKNEAVEGNYLKIMRSKSKDIHYYRYYDACQKTDQETDLCKTVDVINQVIQEEYSEQAKEDPLLIEKVKHLDLSSKNIKNLDPLVGLTQLESLNLEHNQIESLEALKGLTALKYLNLTGNKILRLNLDSIKFLNNIKKVILYHNPICLKFEKTRQNSSELKTSCE